MGEAASRTLSLAIETSNPGAGAGSVALTRDGGAEVVGERTLSPSGRHDDALMPAIDALLRDAGAVPADLAEVAVSLGPGGYTSVRIAVMTAKAICEATGARCVGVPTAAVASSAYEGDANRVLVTLASKRQACWAAVASTTDLHDIDVWGVVEGAEIGSRLAIADVTVALADEHLPESIADTLRARNIILAPIALTARACARAAGAYEAVDPAELAPIYPREPEAVRKWRTLRAND